ncbi:olfactory receptor 9G4-like [Diceros bicornis minor]|uniref:olfactory receptor 9G4-like n=1 Tax=Diceros bicornis minor TaxID=77932 RepID=UPI0026EC9AE6|nr:olfactory receptor 9G4-like [Diceros bicornis minor]XP_058392998.1 olfactory receptor 9G4-like [Diceros bicornis minor]XP_058393003.1 olfactory receptor 9G4-like [Diceros bicornis minor]XP_058393286.1 olfactory receptor 9G4-like [Diceros bicornis minor]
MEVGNRTVLTEFISVGLSADPRWQLILFGIFLMLYLIAMSGNMTMVILICIDSRLHTPMYCFISNLSFLDFWYPSVYIPKILAICVSENKPISLAGCGAQLFFSCLAAYTECYLLAAMACDRLVAICKPLLYSSTMSSSLCTGLVAGSYIGGFLNSIAHIANTFRLSFCGKNIIDHYFCDVTPLVKMSCTDIQVYEKILRGLVGFTVVSNILAILISYFNILLSISRIRSASGRHKAFSTCASHLISVMFFYGSLLFMYSRPSSTYSVGRHKVASLFYTLFNPLLNPLIYSLRNKDVKAAFRKAVQSIRPQR